MGPLDVGIDLHGLGETSGTIHVDHHVNNRGRRDFENRIRAGVLNFNVKRCTIS
jgi:hypothetical protein